METILRGIGVSPGIAVAPALVLYHDRFEAPEYTVSDTAAEWVRLTRAMEATRRDLQQVHEETSSELDATHADIFRAQLMMLDDALVWEELRQTLEKRRVNIERVLLSATQQHERNQTFGERTADFLDVSYRLLHHLMERERPSLRKLERRSMIVSHDLSPADTATIDVEKTAGIALDSGSFTSHTAILARALEVPAVMGLTHATAQIEPGAIMVVDGGEGVVIVQPSPETLERYEDARRRQEEQRDLLLSRAEAETRTHTLDGVEVMTQANVELPVELSHCRKVRAQGIGLYRTEYLFLNRDTLPSEEEQYHSYMDAITAFPGHTVTLRTMDIGGEKLASHLQFSREDNPQLGWRAIRFCLARPDLFKAQLRAMLRAAAHGHTEIMFPMISGIDELRQVKAIVEDVREDLRTRRIPFGEDVRLGTMIEVPSAVAVADLLARECDFFSIGTNDLIQYSLAVDRVNERIAHLYQPAHPAIMRMIARVAAAAKETGIPCGICGEMGGDPLYTEVLLGLGVTTLSMSAIAIPLIRSIVAETSMAEARELAEQVLGMKTSSEIKQTLEKRFQARGVMEYAQEGVRDMPSHQQSGGG